MRHVGMSMSKLPLHVDVDVVHSGRQQHCAFSADAMTQVCVGDSSAPARYLCADVRRQHLLQYAVHRLRAALCRWSWPRIKPLQSTLQVGPGREGNQLPDDSCE